MSLRLWLATFACVSLLGAGVACGDDDDDDATAVTAATEPAVATARAGSSPTAVVAGDTKSEPSLAGPAGKYTVLQEDLGPNFLIDYRGTFVLDTQSYGTSKTFPPGTDGVALLKQWKYMGGFEASFEPEGRETAVLNGRYYVAIESHLFETVDGAKSAMTYFEGRLRNGQNQLVTSVPIGNASSAWKLIFGKVANSSADAAYHRLIFRRGNLVTVVQTLGADSFMRADTARVIGSIVDAKALGERAAVAPTPGPTPGSGQ